MADGYVNVACGNEAIWRRFCAALGLESLLTDERFASNASRVGNRDALSETIESALATWTVKEAIERLAAAEVPVGRVGDLDALFTDPQAAAPRP